MIAVDTSALIEIILREQDADKCQEALAAADRLLLSAATLTECLIVAAPRGLLLPFSRLLNDYGLEIVALTSARARRAGDAYRRWGKGIHPAHLNFGDCFAYALAEEHRCPLLYVGDDFSRTDIISAL